MESHETAMNSVICLHVCALFHPCYKQISIGCKKKGKCVCRESASTERMKAIEMTDSVGFFPLICSFLMMKVA